MILSYYLWIYSGYIGGVHNHSKILNSIISLTIIGHNLQHIIEYVNHIDYKVLVVLIVE